MPLHASILKTLAYFDLFSYSLTKEELYGFLWQEKISYPDFLDALNSSASGWEEKDGYYFLAGRSALVENRRRRLVVSEIKLKIARRAAKKIKVVPFLRAIFVCNSVGAGLAGKESDIDFFIVTTPGRLWLVRFLTNLILKIFRLRTYGERRQDKICLSFFVDENSLDLAPLKAVAEDVHFAFWLYQMTPIYDPRNYYGKFLAANRWVNEFLPNIKKETFSPMAFSLPDAGSGFLKKIWEKILSGWLGDFKERALKSFQLIWLKPSLKEAAKRGDSGVVLVDNVFKSHDNDNRKEIWERWKLIVNNNQ